MSNLFQKIFSVKNEKIHKVITFLGIKIKLKSKVLEARYENKKIKKYLKSQSSDIAKLKKALNTLLKVSNKIIENEKKIKTDVEGIKTSAEGLKTDVEGIKTDIESIKTSAEGLKTDVEGIKTDVESIKTSAEGLKTDIEGIKTSAEGLKTEIDELIFYAHQENPTKDLDLQPRRNMRLHMCEIAADSSAKYIMENLLTAPTFKSRKELLSFALSNVKVNGLYMEFGVFNGNTINHIAKQTPDNTIYGFDSFEGLPETWQSIYTKGFFKVDKLPDVLPNVELVKGWFDESIPRFVQEKGDFKIAFLHSDSDLYSSTKTTFECLKNNIQSGTIIVFDEYLNYPGWEENEHKAFMEFISDTGFKYKYIGYVSSGKQMAIEIL